MPGQQAEDHRTIDQVENYFTINLFSDFPPVDAPLPHHTGGVPPRVEEALAKQCKEGRVALSLGKKLPEKAPKW